MCDGGYFNWWIIVFCLDSVLFEATCEKDEFRAKVHSKNLKDMLMILFGAFTSLRCLGQQTLASVQFLSYSYEQSTDCQYNLSEDRFLSSDANKSYLFVFSFWFEIDRRHYLLATCSSPLLFPLGHLLSIADRSWIWKIMLFPDVFCC